MAEKKTKDSKESIKEKGKSEVNGSAKQQQQDDSQYDQDEVFEYIQKRIRNLQKRKIRLDKYQEVANAGQESTLNADQLNALKNKEAVEAPLKDLKELLELYKAKLNKSTQQEKAAEKKWKQKLKAECDLAKLKGLDIGKEKLDLTVKLLRAVSYKRIVETTVEEETIALEHLLQSIYAGDETSLEVIDKVYEEKDEPVVEGSVTYKQVKAIALTPPEKLIGTEKEVEQVDQEDVKEEEPTKAVLQKISFLQVEENEDEEEQASSQDKDKVQGQELNTSDSKSEAQNGPKRNRKRPQYRKKKNQNQNQNQNQGQSQKENAHTKTN